MNLARLHGTAYARYFAMANGHLAEMVHVGAMDADRARDVLLASAGNPSMLSSVRLHLAWTLRDAVQTLQMAVMQAERDICRDIAPLLDATDSADAIARVASSAAGGKIPPARIDAIVARETSWWIRLHVALDGGHHAS